MKELEVIKLLPVEDRAKMKKKEMPSEVALLIFVFGLCVGLCYWFADEFIFEYRTVSPFWGFVIFLVGGIIIDVFISLIYSQYWSEYNNIIKEANDEIAELIKKGEGSPEELLRLKKELIERKIGNEILSQEEFVWHTNNYCWGCGKRHIKPTMRYTVHKERTESWKEGAFRYTKTFSKTGYINICPDCYSRLMNAKQIDKKNTPLGIVMIIILAIAILFGAYSIWGENGLYISLGVLFFGGFYVLVILASLLLYPFQKHGDTSTTYSFDEIPEIKRFMNQNLPHTH